MRVYVFDDTEPEDDVYLGMANVPLIPLAHDKQVAGIFELRRVIPHTSRYVWCTYARFQSYH